MLPETKLKPLSPRTVSEILKRAIQIYFSNFVPLVALSAMIIIPLTLIQLLFAQPTVTDLTTVDPQALDANALTGILQNALGVLLISAVVGLVQTVLINGLMTYFASESHLGTPATMADALNAIQDRLLPLGGALLVFYLLMIGIAIGTYITLACLIGVLGLGLMLYVGICLNVFLAPVMVLERVGIRDGIARAFVLARSRFWQVAGLVMAVAVLTFALDLIFGLIQQVVFPMESISSVDQIDQYRFTVGMAQGIFMAFIAPILPIAGTIMYYDTRVRNENLEDSFMACENPAPRPRDVDSPKAIVTFNGRDIMIIMALTAIMFVLAFVLAGMGSAVFDIIAPGLPAF